MALLMAAVAEYGPTVVFSSHQVNELERVADYLVVINAGRLQVAGPVDDLLGSHRILIGPVTDSSFEGESFAVVQARRAAAQSQLLIRTGAQARLGTDGWLSQPADLEDIVLAYLRDPSQSALPRPELAVTTAGEPR
jgi:ABC-2 type transport system ATP-binding protein